MAKDSNYNEDSVKSLDWKDHIRLRQGMYIGKLGDGFTGNPVTNFERS